MSESAAGPSKSRTDMAIAFKRARRKFPKDLGKNHNAEDPSDSQSSENEDSVLVTQNIEEPTTNCAIYEEIVPDQIESSLIDTLEEIEISENIEVLCDHCQHQSDNLETVIEQEDVAITKVEEKFDSDCDQQQEPVDNSDDYENAQQYVYNDEQRFQTIWKEEDDSDHVDNADPEDDTAAKDDFLRDGSDYHSQPRDYQSPPVTTAATSGTTRPTHRRRHHRRPSKRNSRPRSCSHLLQLLADLAGGDEETGGHSPGCPYHHGHYTCPHCQHCRRHCCCHTHCCFARCCYNWYFYAVYFKKC